MKVYGRIQQAVANQGLGRDFKAPLIPPAPVSCTLLWFGYTMSFEDLIPNAIFRDRVWGGVMGHEGSDLINELIHQCVRN